MRKDMDEGSTDSRETEDKYVSYLTMPCNAGLLLCRKEG